MGRILALGWRKYLECGDCIRRNGDRSGGGLSAARGRSDGRARAGAHRSGTASSERLSPDSSHVGVLTSRARRRRARDFLRRARRVQGLAPAARRPSTPVRAPWTRLRAAQHSASARRRRAERVRCLAAPAGRVTRHPCQGCCPGTAVPRQEPENLEQFRWPVTAGSCAETSQDGLGAVRRPLRRWRRNRSRAGAGAA
jgi:hypothetical protein